MSPYRHQRPHREEEHPPKGCTSSEGSGNAHTSTQDPYRARQQLREAEIAGVQGRICGVQGRFGNTFTQREPVMRNIAGYGPTHSHRRTKANMWAYRLMCANHALRGSCAANSPHPSPVLPVGGRRRSARERPKPVDSATDTLGCTSMDPDPSRQNPPGWKPDGGSVANANRNTARGHPPRVPRSRPHLPGSITAVNKLRKNRHTARSRTSTGGGQRAC